MFEKLTVAVDSSPESDRAVELARDIASMSGGTVHLVHVIEHVLAAGRAGGFDVEEKSDVTASLDREVAMLKEAGVAHTVSVVHAPVGHAAKEIVAAAKADDADAIIMGSRGLSAFAATFIGSTAYKVLHMADRPVFIGR